MAVWIPLEDTAGVDVEMSLASSGSSVIGKLRPLNPVGLTFTFQTYVVVTPGWPLVASRVTPRLPVSSTR